MSGCAGRKLEEGGRTLTNVTNETRRGGNFPMGLRRRKSNEHSPSSQKSPPGAGEGLAANADRARHWSADDTVADS